MEESTRPREAVGAATIAEAFRITAAGNAGDIAVRTKDDEVVDRPGASCASASTRWPAGSSRSACSAATRSR